MNVIEAIVLGLVQGLTEFIPVSSSGHLIIAQQLFGMAPDHLFIEFINFGTLLALLIYFRKRIVDICKDVFVNHNFLLARNILITAIPAGAIGFLLSGFIETSPFFSSLIVVTISLAAVGLLMIIVDKLPKASPKEHGQSLSPSRSLWIGIVQIFALIPGVSRSGSTILAGRIAGLSAAAAAEYSFLVSLPIMIGVSIKLLVKSSDRAYLLDHLPMLLLSNAVAFISGLIAVGFLMKYLSKHGLAAFGWYRLCLAGILAVVLLLK
jgi:undecaprenyl-diphosphatase